MLHQSSLAGNARGCLKIEAPGGTGFGDVWDQCQGHNACVEHQTVNLDHANDVSMLGFTVGGCFGWCSAAVVI